MCPSDFDRNNIDRYRVDLNILHSIVQYKRIKTEDSLVLIEITNESRMVQHGVPRLSFDMELHPRCHDITSTNLDVETSHPYHVQTQPVNHKLTAMSLCVFA